jgi:hypothetical protein
MKTEITLDYIPKKNSTRITSNKFIDHVEFTEHLFDLWSNTQTAKDDNLLISTAHHEPNDIGIRKIINIKWMSGIILDFDNKVNAKTFDHFDFIKLFPELYHISTNSFSQNNFRIVIPSKHKFPPNIYSKFWNHIYLTISDSFQNSGIDMTKRAVNAFFYAPCRVVGSTGNFFIPSDGEVFDPTEWLGMKLRTIPQFTTPPQANVLPVNVIHTKTAYKNALARWQANCKVAGKQNAEFFRFASVLHTIGMSLVDIEAELSQQAKYALEPQKRYKHIKEIITTLSR